MLASMLHWQFHHLFCHKVCYGLQAIVGERGNIIPTFSLRYCANFQSNLDGKCMDISRGLREILQRLESLRFIQFYADSPHLSSSSIHPVLEQYHLVVFLVKRCNKHYTNRIFERSFRKYNETWSHKHQIGSCMHGFYENRLLSSRWLYLYRVFEEPYFQISTDCPLWWQSSKKRKNNHWTLKIYSTTHNPYIEWTVQPVWAKRWVSLSLENLPVWSSKWSLLERET